MIGRWPLISIAAFAVAAAWLMQGPGYNQNSHYALVKALAAGTPRIDTTRFETGDLSTQDLAYDNGHYYSDKPPGLAIVVLPTYVALRAVGVRTSGDPTVMLWALGLVGVVLPAVLLVVLMALVVEALEPRMGIPVALVIGTGTLLMPFATMFFSHALSALLVFAAFAAAWRGRRGSVAWLALAGMLTAFAVTTEYPNAVAGAAVGVYAVAKRGAIVRRAIVYGAGSLTGLLPLLAYHAWAFGSPFESARSHALYFRGEGAIERAGETGGLFGLDAFPSLTRAVTLLFTEWGLLTATPMVFLALLGVVALARQGWRAEAVLIGSVWLVYLILHMSYYSIFGDFAGGPRYLVPVLPLLALPLAAAARRWPGEALGLTIASVALMAGLTLARPLFAGEGTLLTRIHDRQFPPTASSLIDVSSVSAALVFPFVLAIAGFAAIASLTHRRLRREHLIAALVALLAWVVVRESALSLLGDGSPNNVQALAVVAIALVAVAGVVGARHVMSMSPRQTE